MNANGLPQLAAAADARGLTAYARLCRASAAMWQDMANQIVRGGEVIVRFPDEFLVVIPGAPLTPWANLRAAAPAQQAQRPAPPAPADPTGLQALYASQAKKYPPNMT